jgi:hypothetical protein
MFATFNAPPNFSSDPDPTVLAATLAFYPDLPFLAALLCPQLEDVYGEVYRVLKPGALFLSYEWVSTGLFDPSNPTHVRIMDEINFGNGLPVRGEGGLGSGLRNGLPVRGEGEGSIASGWVLGYCRLTDSLTNCLMTCARAGLTLLTHQLAIIEWWPVA